ncbi:MAG: LacI family DNA-binding transcriptional regulator [Caulobacterales bacterium]|nr:LacI family DNA-binding transcriptional regulator [Caulobacterales bacterium]
MGPNKKPTIDDVARLAGVGRTSVSRVLNNGPNVRPELREKIQKAVSSLNFQVNQQARSLASGRHKNIAIINASDFDEEPNSYYTAALEIGALRTCANKAYHLQTHSINQNSPDAKNKIGEIITRNQYIGIILTPPFSDNKSIIETALENDCKVVCISSSSSSQNLASVIGIDDEKAGYEITKNLIEKGHRKFAYIKGLEHHLSAEKRFDGFIRATKEAKIKLDETLHLRGNFTFKSGIETAQKIFESKKEPSALICANDDMAAGALFSAHKFGLKVPEDISIVGFDDTPVSEIVWPPLTTVHQPLKEMGSEAVELLINIIENRHGEIKPFFKFINFKIIERQSAAQPKSN